MPKMLRGLVAALAASGWIVALSIPPALLIGSDEVVE
jgi:hypothetical protein